jgi:hypothetical protein
MTMQGVYRKWVGTLPPGLEASATVDALRAICELDLSRAIIPAATQNNLGNALWMLGEQESGTARRSGKSGQTERARWSNGIKRVHVTHRMKISLGYRLISRESAKEACR